MPRETDERAWKADTLRDGNWWLRSYYFLKQFRGYALETGTFLDGTYERVCLRFGNVWCGPEIEISNISGYAREDGRRLLSTPTPKAGGNG